MVVGAASGVQITHRHFPTVLVGCMLISFLLQLTVATWLNAYVFETASSTLVSGGRTLLDFAGPHRSDRASSPPPPPTCPCKPDTSSTRPLQAASQSWLLMSVDWFCGYGTIICVEAYALWKGTEPRAWAARRHVCMLSAYEE